MKEFNMGISAFGCNGCTYTPERIPLGIRTLHFDGGYAVYADASLACGFDPDRSIAVYPDIPDTSDFVAIVNHSDFWCRPFWGTSLSELPSRTQELLIRRETDYLCILPVCADVFKTVLCGNGGRLEAKMYSNCASVTECRDQLAFVCMEGNDPDVLLHDIARKAAELLGTGLGMREDKTLPEVLGYLGWCSWDALHIHVSHEGLVEKAEEFRKKGVPVHYAIIDDMWADVPDLETIPYDISLDDMVKIMHRSKLRSFDASPLRFPQGMAAAVADIKKAGIPNVGVWFPTTGYWSGFMPDSPDAAALADVLEVSAVDTLIAAPDKEKARIYFDTLCARAKSWGSDFCKIDNQGCHKKYRNMAPIGQSARALQSAIDSAMDKYFGGALINCMGMPSECMFNRPTGAVSRCSDDFQPESREWFSKNVLQCAYNGLLQGQYYINDWDMWWTDDEQAIKNSVCRAVSGGPVYVSDTIGRTIPEVLQPVAMSDGKLLRCDNSASPAVKCFFEDPTVSGSPFIIRNRAGKAGICAVFNIDKENRAVSGTLSPSDAGLPAGRYAYYEYFTGLCGVLEDGSQIRLRLSDRDSFFLYTFVPFDDGIAVLGRTDKYVGVAAVTPEGSGRYAVYEGGEVCIAAEDGIGVKVFSAGHELDVCRRGGGLFFNTGSGTEFTVVKK